MRDTFFPYLPKDFIETAEGLIFAVISYHPHAEKVGCSLRYVKDNGNWNKVETETANRLLEKHYPHYLFNSGQFDAKFHAVSQQYIAQHYRPDQALTERLSREPKGLLEVRLHALVAVLGQYDVDCNALGLTGSMLIHQQRESSDIDLVVYGRKAFHQARNAVKQAIAAGQIQALDDILMRENFERRNGDLDYVSFSWHEQRKFNKAVIEGSKFDIGMVGLPHEVEVDHRQYRKRGFQTFKAKVVDDSQAYDFPARYWVDNASTPEIVCFTHTYVGQAKVGEIIEVSGAMECDNSGYCRIVVGSSREATGEYIKVSN